MTIPGSLSFYQIYNNLDSSIYNPVITINFGMIMKCLGLGERGESTIGRSGTADEGTRGRNE